MRAGKAGNKFVGGVASTVLDTTRNYPGVDTSAPPPTLSIEVDMSIDERDEMQLVTGERGQGMSTAILHVSNQMGNEVQTTSEKRQPFGQWILRMTVILVIYLATTLFVISTINDAMALKTEYDIFLMVLFGYGMATGVWLWVIMPWARGDEIKP